MSARNDRGTRAPELDDVSRALASLALARMRQDGRLRVRQREQLRRALSKAADALGWIMLAGGTGDRVERAAKDVSALADAGLDALQGDLANEVADKKGEIDELGRVARSVQMLATKDEASFPTEVAYSRTARTGTRDLITKTEILTLSDADEARSAVARLEKHMEGWTKLRDQMLEELRGRQRQLRDVKGSLPSFLDTSQGLVREVLQTLY